MASRTGTLTLKGRRVLVTGASGYLASRLAWFLSGEGAHVLRFSQRPERLAPLSNTSDVTGDPRKRTTWSKLLQDADIVYHLAAQTSHRISDEDPRTDWDANVLPVLHLLETCRQSRSRPLVILAGTATEAGHPRRVPVNEDQPDDPLTIYDLHKLTAERYVKQYVRWGFVRGTTLRLPNVYGPGPIGSSADRGVLNATVRRALRGETVNIYGRGDHLRDYLYIDDAARAFVAAGQHPEEVSGRHFIVGTGQGSTIADAFRLAVERVAVRTGRRVPVEHVEPPEPLHPIELRDFVADPTALSRATRWRAEVSLSDGLDLTIEHMLKEGSQS